MVSCQSALICFDYQLLVMYSYSHKPYLEDHITLIQTRTKIYNLKSLLRLFHFLYQLHDLCFPLFHIFYFSYIYLHLFSNLRISYA